MMKIKLKDKNKPIEYFNSMMGFSPESRARLNAGEVVEVEYVREDAKLFVSVIEEKKVKDKENGTK